MKNLRCSALVASAYVSLCLGDYLIALEYAQELLQQSNLCGVHKMLGHLYAAEALVLTDRISDAIEHLNPDLVTELNVNMTPPLEELAEGHPKPLKGSFGGNAPFVKNTGGGLNAIS